MKKLPFVFFSLLAILIGFSLYIHFNYYLSNGSVDAERVSNIAIAKNDPLLCDKILIPIQFDGPSQSDVQHECYFLMAHKLKSQKICEYIPDSSYRDICISDIGVMTKDISSCEKIPGQLDKGSCYERFTEIGADRSVCEKVDDSTKGTQISGKELCYIGAAQYSKDISICTRNIQSPGYRDSCYKAIAMETKNVSLCDRVVAQYERDDCKRYISESSR